jgi:hypothetical protein
MKETTQYIVVECYDEFSRAVVITARGGELEVTQAVTAAAIHRAAPDGYRAMLDTLLSACVLDETAQALLVFDTSDATVMQQQVSLTRPDWNAEITMTELENSIRHGVWQSFQRDRAAAARFLATTELQTRLGDVDVVQLKLDGHRVISPIGFRSHVIDCLLRQTFVRLLPWQMITDRLGADKILSMVERSGLWAGYAALAVKEKGLFLDIGQTKTVVYELSAGALSYRDTVLWGTDRIFLNVSKTFGLPMSFAPALIDRYAMEKTSPAVRKQIALALQSEFAVLMHTIESCRTTQTTPVYVHSVVPLPDFLGQEKLMRQLGITSPYHELSAASVLGRGSVVHYNRTVIGDGLTPSYDTALALVHRYGGGGHETLLSKSAKQRARWITLLR